MDCLEKIREIAYRLLLEQIIARGGICGNGEEIQKIALYPNADEFTRVWGLHDPSGIIGSPVRGCAAVI
jgi:hypothetical protein